MNLLEILGKVGFDWQVAVANLVNFLIIYWVLKRFAFGPIRNIIAKRQASISTGLEQAAAAEDALADAQKEAAKITDSARIEATNIVTLADQQAKRFAEASQDQARKQADDIIDKARAQIENERDQAATDLRKQAASLISDGVEKVLGEELSDDQRKSAHDKALAFVSADAS